MFTNQVILITGGTGSFGNAVIRRFLHTQVGEIRVFSRDEKKQEDMRLQFPDRRVRFYVGDVRDSRSVHAALRGVNYVFHAAALKQVPSCEFHPMEAVLTNVLGADNVVTAAIDHGVERVVLLSTDKAVYPINAMGLSKATMEKVVTARARTLKAGDTVLCTTRYGNVMGSRGSVIPLFVQQLKDGRELTVTDPNMTRFLMSLDESVDLVLFAFQHGRQGDILVQKAPACTVGVLAEALSRMFGRAECRMKIIGTRHGEKLYETLVSREEMARAEELELYYRIPVDARDLNYAAFSTTGEVSISQAHDFTSHNTRRLSLEETMDLLLHLDMVRDHRALGTGPRPVSA